MTNRNRTCIVACSVLKQELTQLCKQGDLDAELVFVSKYYHVDYSQIEKNLRPILNKAVNQFNGNVILVYGNLCLGVNNEMQKLAEEYDVVKIDALNCVDCQLGGKGKSAEVDPNHDILFLSPGMADFFSHVKEMMRHEDISEDHFKMLFRGLRGIILLDTLGDSENLREIVEKLDTGLCIVDTKKVGLENIRTLVKEAFEKNRKKRKQR